MQRKALLLIAAFLFTLAIFFRFYQLGQIPIGLNKDETAIGYNAYSILKTGKDEYGIQMPLYFKSFNDYKLPVYIYMTVASEKVFGITPLAIRFPSAIFGVITIISLFFLVKLLSRRLDLAIASAIFLAFNPWQFFFSRSGFEVNVATAFATLGSLLFVFTVRNKGNIFFLILSLFSFGLSLYSYNVARIISPLLLISLVLLYLRDIRKWPVSRFVISIPLGFLIILPFILTFIKGSGLHNQVGEVFLTSTYMRAQQIELRSYLFFLPTLYSKFFFNSFVLMTWEYFRNLIMSFSVNFFFINGARFVNGVANLGMFYPFEFVTIALGIYCSIKKRVSYLYFFLIWIALVNTLVSLTIESPHATRSFMLVVPLSIFSAYGFLFVWKYLAGVKKRSSKKFLQIITLIIAGYGLIYYFTIYFFMFPANQAQTWRSAEPELIAFLTAHEKEYDKIIIDSKTDISYTAIAFYGKIPPAVYQKEVVYKKDGLLESAARIGKYEFTTIDWDLYDGDHKTLYVTTPDGYTNKPIHKTFYYPQRPVVLSSNGVITSFSHKDTAYVLIR